MGTTDARQISASLRNKTSEGPARQRSTALWLASCVIVQGLDSNRSFSRPIRQQGGRGGSRPRPRHRSRRRCCHRRARAMRRQRQQQQPLQRPTDRRRRRRRRIEQQVLAVTAATALGLALLPAAAAVARCCCGFLPPAAAAVVPVHRLLTQVCLASSCSRTIASPPRD